MIITCPYCLINGEKKNLAETTSAGVKIIRSINGEIDFTLINAKEFEIICGNCLNTVLYRKPTLLTPQVDITLAWGTIYQYYANSSIVRV